MLRLRLRTELAGLEISDIAVIIAVSSPHRSIAYKANEYAIERMKQMVPIWKKEHWEDGESWIGDQSGQTPYPEGIPLLRRNQND